MGNPKKKKLVAFKPPAKKSKIVQPTIENVENAWRGILLLLRELGNVTVAVSEGRHIATSPQYHLFQEKLAPALDKARNRKQVDYMKLVVADIPPLVRKYREGAFCLEDAVEHIISVLEDIPRVKRLSNKENQKLQNKIAKLLLNRKGESNGSIEDAYGIAGWAAGVGSRTLRSSFKELKGYQGLRPTEEDLAIWQCWDEHDERVFLTIKSRLTHVLRLLDHGVRQQRDYRKTSPMTATSHSVELN